ncbi:MAG TPA: MDR family MFS transporter [Streptosporangiaceae bacterium]|nr:MDR family MFS transporter [Streptosporangiaceae bacterium]
MSEVKAVAGEGNLPAFGRRRDIMIVLPGLLLALMLAMLDQLVVSTALPRIVGDLGGLNHLSWVVTAYVLASTITTPLYGKLGDLYGRKRLLVAAIVIFLIGSALSGQAHSMDQLIVFRALQGLGAGGLIVGAIATIGDLVSPRERGQYMGYMMAAMMIAMIAGPLVGGYITDSLSWRWIFYINMPIGGAALLYLLATLRLPVNKIAHKIDYLGAAVLAVGATSIVLVTTWGGSQYAWGSPTIMSLIALAIVSVAAFIWVESRAAEPILPTHVFKNRNFSIASGMSFLLGLAMFGAMTFLPLYQQTVQHASPTVSGLLLIPMMLGATTTSLLAGQFTVRTGKYKALPIVGAAIMTVAMLLLAMLGPSTSRLTSMGLFVLFGIGMGFLMQITTLIAQNSVSPADMGVASSSRSFFQQIGGSIGVSIFGVVFFRALRDSLAAHLPTFKLNTSGGGLDPAQVQHFQPAVRHAVYVGIAHGLDIVFLWAAPTAAIVFAIGWLVKEIPLRSSRDAAPGQESKSEPEPVLVD